MVVSSIIIRSAKRVVIALLATFVLPIGALAQDSCERIIALSPSLVEVIDQLELTDKLVAVSRYTEYPEAARELAEVGGLLDPNIEAILSHKPTVVFGLSEHGDLLQKLQRVHVRSATLDHRRLAGILDSITSIGAICRIEARAQALRMKLQKKIDLVQRETFGKKKERALVLVGNKQDALTLNNLYVSGRDGFYADLLSLAGAENVFRGLTGAFSGVSREALIQQNPEFIFHIVSGEQVNAFERRAILVAWDQLPYLKAVQQKQVIILSDYVDSIPGPRFLLVLEKIYAALHGGAGLP